MDHVINNPCISHVFKNIIKLRSPGVNIDEDFKELKHHYADIDDETDNNKEKNNLKLFKFVS